MRFLLDTTAFSDLMREHFLFLLVRPEGAYATARSRW